MHRKTLAVLALFLFAFTVSFAQTKVVSVSGTIKDKAAKTVLPFVNVVLKTEKDTAFVTGTVSNEEGRFTLSNVKPDNYFLEISYVGYTTKRQSLFVGTLSEFLEVPTIELEEATQTLGEVTVTAKQDEISGKMDKKTFSVEDNISQSGDTIIIGITFQSP